MSHTSYRVLHITAGHEDFISWVAVASHTPYIVLCFTVCHIDMISMGCSDILHLTNHVTYHRCPCRHGFNGRGDIPHFT